MPNVRVYKAENSYKKKFYMIDIENFKEKGNYFNAFNESSLQKATLNIIGHSNYYTHTKPELGDYCVSYEKPFDCLFNMNEGSINNLKNLNFLEKRAFEFYLKRYLRKKQKGGKK